MTDRNSHTMSIFPRAVQGAIIACFSLACLWFAMRQNIWIDESTQLSGLTLSPGKLIRWLAGVDTSRFGVPGDRMPPLGYLLDWTWWHGVSRSVPGFRLFHVALVVVALWLFAQVERTHVGARWCGIGLIFLAISPKTIQLATELRAYPMLFACACVQAALFLRLVATPDRPSYRSLSGFGLLCVATSFIHFFGVVSAFAYFGALLLRFVRVAASRVILAGVLTVLPMLALKPFVAGASAVSGEAIVVGLSPSQYLLQLIGSSAYLVLPVAGTLFLGGCAALLLAGIAGAVRRAVDRRAAPVDHMVVVAALGVSATIVPHFFVHAFDTLKPSYSIWLLPVLALIIASGARQVTTRAMWLRRGVQAAGVAVVFGATVSTIIFLTYADWYVHGPSRTILSTAGSDVPIVYIGDDTYAYGYFPMVYLSERRASQWLARKDGIWRLPDIANGTAQPLTALAGSGEIAIVDIRLRRYADLGQCLRGTCPSFERSPIMSAMLADGHWREGPSIRAFGYYDTTVTRLRATGK